MSEAAWPTSTEVHAEVSRRLSRVLELHGGAVAEVARRTLAEGWGPLSAQPHSLTSVLVPGACLCAGGTWRTALWPAVAAECMMAAADLFDDVADADMAASAAAAPAGIMLTAAAGLLALAGATVVRVVEDGATGMTAVALAQLLGTAFVSAANGQAANLQMDQQGVDPLAAYRQAVAKAGPLGSVIARLGARTATSDDRIVDLLGEFGRRLAVRSQLLNDARDAAPGAEHDKADVRAGARTVPLVFAGSGGAPGGLSGAELAAWEHQERARIAAGGGLAAAMALAEAERLRAMEALDQLEHLGHPVAGLRALIH